MLHHRYHFLNPSQELSAAIGKLQVIFDLTLKKATALTEKVEVEIFVEESCEDTIPTLGTGGKYIKAERRIDIYLDLTNEHLQNNFAAEVARTLSHEYMHAVREEYVAWEDGTLLDSLIAEGLAQSFELEVQPNLAPAIYSTSFTEAERAALWEKARPILQQRGPENDAWFFGSEKIKRWAGYALGFKLVQDKMKQSGLPASKLHKTPARDYLNTM